MTTLLECFDRHGCDRGYRHHYERLYEPILEPVRNEELVILEVGIYKGAGIAAFLDYLPNAIICGIDTFERIRPEEVLILQHERVAWKEGDSRTIDLPYCYGFDFIFDDGGHQPLVQAETFKNLYPLLRPGGKYFIEDVWAVDLMSAKQVRNNAWINRKEFLWERFETLYDTIGEYKRHNLRKGGAGDSCILEIC